MANPWCCPAKDARHCRRQTPGAHMMSSEQRPDILVPHYENGCSCFSCRWVRGTECPFILSNMEHQILPYPVVNPTHHRVQPQERQRLMTEVAKKSFQIMYIYAMQLEDGKWGWVVVLPTPLLPFLLTDDNFFGVARVARHPVHGWFGLKSDGCRVQIGHEMSPPLYNPLYPHYGYDPQSSPYRLYQPPHEEMIVDNNSHPSSGDDTNPGTSPRSSVHVSAAGNDKRPENPWWVVIGPSFANPPVFPGDGNYRCYDLSPIGKYNCQHGYNRHTDRANTTIFVGGLVKKMTQEQLHYWFEGFGELLHVRKKIGQTCGFVQYASRKEAEMAISQMQGFPVHGARFRLSWGSPEKHIDQEYWKYYEDSAQEAYKGWQEFAARMSHGEARREDDPSFW